MNSKDILRLLDANSNRAREGVRTAEDYVRFAVGDCRWAKKLQVLRRQVTETVVAHFAANELLAARSVQTDGGHPDRPNEPDQAPRSSSGEEPKGVALRGLKRAQEALRVLEEYTRGNFPEASKAFSKTRFGLYEAEQWLVAGSDAARILAQARLYVLITEALCAHGLEQTARAALAGGAEVLQLREKKTNGSDLLDKARRLKDLCTKQGALLVINDRADVALAAGAASVHLGQDDLAPLDVRRWAGEQLLIGRSTHSLEQARRAATEESVDYLAIGSMYETATKPEYTLVGPALAQAVCQQPWDVPVFAIGGITAARAKELRKFGVRRIAVSSAVISAADPERQARELWNALEG